MTKETIIQLRIYFLGIITIGIWSLLLWNHLHGGVVSHHLLHQKNLPAVSNWWGGLILPLLTFYLTSRIKKRIISNNKPEQATFPKSIIYGFLLALIYGVLLSVFFTMGYSNAAGYMTYGIFILALIFPIFRAEYLLGFVIGMTYTFGAVLPTIVGLVFVLITFILYRYIRAGILFLLNKLLSL